MFTAIRHALFGFNRDEQEDFLVRQIYRLSKWVEQANQAAHVRRIEASQPGAPSDRLLDELNAELTATDHAKARVADGLVLSRAEFKALREQIARLERAMDVVPD